MKGIVNASTFNAFKERYLDTKMLPEYEVYLHGSLAEKNGSLAYFQIPPKTSVVMFSPPGYKTYWRGEGYLTASEKEQLRLGNLTGRKVLHTIPAKYAIPTKYTYSVMYISGDVVPDVRLTQETMKIGRRGVFKNGRRLQVHPSLDTLSSLLQALGPGLYYVSSCRGLRIVFGQKNRMRLVPFVKKMQLANFVARVRQRKHSPNSQMYYERHYPATYNPSQELMMTRNGRLMSGMNPMSRHERVKYEDLMTKLEQMMHPHVGSVSARMKLEKLDPKNPTLRTQFEKRLLRKFGFNVGDLKDMERKYYIHRHRLDTDQRRDLELARRVRILQTQKTAQKTAQKNGQKTAAALAVVKKIKKR